MKYLLFMGCLCIATSVYADPPKVVPVPKPNQPKIETIEGCVVNKLFELNAMPASKWHVERNDNIELRRTK